MRSVEASPCSGLQTRAFRVYKLLNGCKVCQGSGARIACHLLNFCKKFTQEYSTLCYGLIFAKYDDTPSAWALGL